MYYYCIEIQLYIYNMIIYVHVGMTSNLLQPDMDPSLPRHPYSGCLFEFGAVQTV